MDKMDAGRRLYTALQGGDVDTLTALLADDFVGDLTPNLPNGYGASPYRGREVMLNDGWGRVGAAFAMSPQVDELIVTEDYIIGRGRYVGETVETKVPVEARFAHFWRVEGDRIIGVVQVTDSAAWEHALNR
ncbi:MAG: nuclear transport factor 2 family protein [Phycicoccus sp.]